MKQKAVIAMSCFSCCASEAQQDHQIIDPVDEDNSKAGAKPAVAEDHSKAGAKPALSSEDADDEVSGSDVQRGFITFNVDMKKTPSEKLGLDLDIISRTYAQVCEVQPGAIQTYNQTSTAEEVKYGDCIVEVNGVYGDAKSMAKVMKEEKSLNIVFRRGNEYTVTIETKSHPHGLKFAHTSRSVSLVISEMQEGPVTEWNDANPDRRVSIGDRIVAFNGNRMAPADLMSEINDSTLSKMDFLVVSIID